ncbi:unnamed protein product [Mytilus coruscus]|uniref:DUF7869 domain-containing protein n=1 Tax=Mytilus coruscus TaxID=42192 RepID=A0A6J8CXD9_MYTCO|nr:unnamed protein product [Mytilus coruscus]
MVNHVLTSTIVFCHVTAASNEITWLAMVNHGISWLTMGSSDHCQPWILLTMVNHGYKLWSERRDYYKKKDEACMKSKEVVSIIIDGMDQSKTNIPHFKGWTRPKAYLSFLLKGHTHEDIGQRFSVISQRLRRVNAMTLLQLQKEIESSFHDKPHQEVLDVKSWLDNSLCEMSFHSSQHQFWLFCDRPNHVTLKYRKCSTDSWLPEAGQNQIELFDLDITGDNTIPQEYTWWMEFLNNPTKATPKITRWPLTNLQKIHKIIDIPIQLVPTEDPEPSCISEMLESEGLIREV